MAKTNAPAEVKIDGVAKPIKTNALPDPFDELDLLYRPRLPLLPNQVDRRAGIPVLDQKGNSCTGQAVAALINTVLSDELSRKPAHGAPRKSLRTRVSPYMIYALARRYDEYPGESDIGSSLRGAFKAWYKHGVCSETTWPPNHTNQDLYDDAFVEECQKTPLGAYYRVNARRIDDMQSAITELNAIAVSAAVHDGWLKPVREGTGKNESWVIRSGTEQIGGHAFAIAGYNDTGFLVQNSWGVKWGHNGYATLPYQDWLENGYDAWVGRPGVPQIGKTQQRRIVVPAGRTIVAAAGPSPARLRKHIVNVTAEGRLSPNGNVFSDQVQLDELAKEMETQIESWFTQDGANLDAHPRRRVVFYAHGGLVGEGGGISVADRMIDWWKANHIYPIHIVWESDALTTVFSFIEEIKRKLPFGGILDGVWEQLDAKLENAGRNIQRLWTEMKDNAEAASKALDPNKKKDAPEQPGVTQFITRLKKYQVKHQDLEIHLVGHSAGSVVLAAMVDRLAAENIPVESLQLMGGALRVDKFLSVVAPKLQPTAPGKKPMLGRFTAYDLKEKAELDDTCPGPPIAIYHKSLLYYVARALEPTPSQYEVPMVGIERLFRPHIAVIGGESNLITAPNNEVTPDCRSKAKGHGEFDDDPDTMTSVVLRITKRTRIADVTPYPKGGMKSPGN